MTVEDEDDEGIMMCLKVTKEWKERSRQKTGGKMKTGIDPCRGTSSGHSQNRI